MREENRASILQNNDRYRRTTRSRMRRIRQLRCRVAISVAALCISAIIGVFGCSFLSKAQSADNTISYKYFTSIQVKSGDTLYSIANEYADEHYESVYAYMEEVCLTNHMLDTDVREGDYLIVPYYSTEFR